MMRNDVECSDEVACVVRFLAMRIGLAALCLGILCGSAAADGDVPLPPEMRFAALPARVPDPKDNPSTPEKIALGRQLFFDPILSMSGTIACATCHQPARGWTDGRATAVGAAPLRRNTPTILNVGFNTGGAMFWDNREQGLEAQSLHPLRGREEMRGTGAERDAVAQAVERVSKVPAYREAFDGKVTAEGITHALAVFERSLVTTDTAFDLFMRGDTTALTEQQQRGMKAFTKAGCQHCHGGPMLSDFKLHVVGGPGERQAFRTPTLRNLPHTAPYMHNGRLRTLDDVLVFYDLLMDEVSETLEGGDQATQPPLDPLLRIINVDPEEFDDLKAFLEALSDPHYDRSAPESVPSGLRVEGGMK
jgi:cytochrome c peroxidase